MENTVTLENKISADVNHFPSITWHHLHINHGHFDGAIDSSIDISIENPNDFVEVKKVSLDDGCIPKAIRTQIGEDFENALNSLESEKQISVNFIKILAGKKIDKAVKLNLSTDSQKNQCCETVIVAEENSCSSFVFEYSSRGNGDGLFGHRIRIVCCPYSDLKVSSVNLLSKGVLHYNCVGVCQKENSLFDLTQIDLGAKNVVTGSQIVLEGIKAKSSVRSGYFVDDKRNIDVNYVSRHLAKETSSSCFYNGIVDGESKKAWRGTIDFVKGCCESVGDEQENVLLLNPCVVNKSMPVILCGEEDVEGRHGSSIGRLNEEELLYLESRGINKAEARALMIRSRVNAIARYVPDERIREKIGQFLEENL